MSSYEFYELEQMLGGLAAASAGINFVSFAFTVLTYVLSSLGIYTVASRRGIHHAWLSWVPVVNIWVLGSLSDQYRYVAKGQVKSKRKALIIMQVINVVLAVVMICAVIGGVVGVVLNAGYMDEEQLLMEAMGPILGSMVLLLPLAGLSIAIVVVRFMALYDVYMSMDPENAVLFLVLSIFISVTEPFFLFFNREKDKGMPPRQPRYREPQQNGGYQAPQQNVGYQPDMGTYDEAPAEKPYGESRELPSEPRSDETHYL